MRSLLTITAAAMTLALGLPNAAWALWSLEPTDRMDSDPLSVVGSAPPLAAGPQLQLGYTPPLDSQKLNSAIEGAGSDPLTRHLAVGRAGEVIDLPALGGEDSAVGGTYTRVNHANLLAKRKKAAPAEQTADVPIPGPATYWLLLCALPALLLARRRLTGRSPS